MAVVRGAGGHEHKPTEATANTRGVQHAQLTAHRMPEQVRGGVGESFTHDLEHRGEMHRDDVLVAVGTVGPGFGRLSP